MEHLAVLEHEGAHAVRFAGLDRVIGLPLVWKLAHVDVEGAEVVLGPRRKAGARCTRRQSRS
jgi:hypothetical protein